MGRRASVGSGPPSNDGHLARGTFPAGSAAGERRVTHLSEQRNEACEGGDLHLRHHSATMNLDGLFCDAESCRNLLVAQSARHQIEHLALAARQLAEALLDASTDFI